MQIPVPPSYVTRLRVIYNEVTEAIYGTQGTITTVQTSTDRFEAYATIQNCTHKYSGPPQKNAASAQTLAIYYSLKQMTNILGYQIVDLNYSVLSQLLTALNKLAVHISLQQCCVSYVREDIELVYESFNHLLNEYSMASDEIENISYLHDTMHELDNTMTGYYNSIVNSSDEFADSKVTQITPS